MAAPSASQLGGAGVAGPFPIALNPNWLGSENSVISGVQSPSTMCSTRSVQTRMSGLPAPTPVLSPAARIIVPAVAPAAAAVAGLDPASVAAHNALAEELQSIVVRYHARTRSGDGAAAGAASGGGGVGSQQPTWSGDITPIQAAASWAPSSSSGTNSQAVSGADVIGSMNPTTGLPPPARSAAGVVGAQQYHPPSVDAAAARNFKRRGNHAPLNLPSDDVLSRHASAAAPA